MAKLMRTCGFYPDGDEPTDVWGLFPAGTTTIAPMRIPPGVLKDSPLEGTIGVAGTRLYIYLGAAWHNFVDLAGDVMTGPLGIGIGALAPQSNLHVASHMATTFAFRLYHYEATFNTNYKKLTRLRWDWDSTLGDFLYICATGNASSTARMAILLSQNKGIWFGKGNDSGNNIYPIYVTIDAQGRVAIDRSGNTSPTARLQLPAGQSSAGEAPLKIPPGALLSTPEAGAVEADSTRLYWTPSSTRKSIAFFGDNAKNFNFTATDRLLGRASAGAGAGEEIICTAAGRALLDDADAATQRTTLGLGDSATKNVGTEAGTVAAGDHTHAATELTMTAENKILGRVTAGAGAVEEINCTEAGRSLLDDASAAAQRTTLGLIDDVAVLAPGAAAAWTDQPADLTELFGSAIHRVKFDLATANQARFLVNVATAGATGAKLAVQYSPDQSTWSYLDGSSGPAAGIDSAGLIVSPWVNLAAGAKADVFLRVVGLGGDGVADPAFGRVSVQFR